MSAASIGQFREWARRGIERSTDSARRVQAYYALESKASQEALFKIEGGLTLDAVSHTLRLYVEGLTGRVLNIAVSLYTHVTLHVGASPEITIESCDTNDFEAVRDVRRMEYNNVLDLFKAAIRRTGASTCGAHSTRPTPASR